MGKALNIQGSRPPILQPKEKALKPLQASEDSPITGLFGVCVPRKGCTGMCDLGGGMSHKTERAHHREALQ